MATTKRNSQSWLVPSFDSISSKKPIARKRSNSQISIDDTLDSKLVDIIPRKQVAVNSLSTLLTACEPSKSSELAVSRRKQQEIVDWLQCKTPVGKPSALIISGPSGCGKTVSFRLLAKENGFDVVEWISPIDRATDENNRKESQGDIFEDFMIRVTRYNSVLSNVTRRILLVKDFPNVYSRDKDRFAASLEEYFLLGKEPIVFICTDDGSFSILQNLFPPSIKERFVIDHIGVHAATLAAMKNVLKRVSMILNTKASHFLSITQRHVEEVLSEGIGDVRSTILNLIFRSLKVPENQYKSDCNCREESLGLLHGIGRVINPKKTGQGPTAKFVHDPDEIASYFQSQSTVFVRFLQENYLNTLKNIEDACSSADVMSLADILASEWRDTNLAKVTLSFCVRGIMVHNGTPVSGWNPVRKPRNDECKVQRDLAAAEIRCYESLIAPKSKKSTTTPLYDSVIEDVIE